MNRRLLAIVLATLLVIPAAAFAASSIRIEGTDYYAEGAPEGGFSDKGRNNDPDGPDTWHWDGKNDLTLNGYDGGYIAADGDLTITLKGDNTVSDDYKTDQDRWYDITQYSISLSGDENAIVGTEGSTLHTTHPIVNHYGDLTIKDATIDADGQIVSNAGSMTIENSSIDQDGGMLRAYGELNIINSDIDFESPNSIAVSTAFRDGKPYAHLNITDSNVRAVVKNPAQNHAYPAIKVGDDKNNYCDSDNQITITNSHVEASSPNSPAIISFVYYYSSGDWQSRTRGAIKLVNSEVITPEGGRVVNVASVDNISLVRNPNYAVLGQTIGFEDATDLAAALADGTIAKDVVIDPVPPEPEPEPEPDPEPTPEPTPGPTPTPTPGPSPAPAPAPAPATVLPKTADATLILEGAVAASGTLLALAGVLRRRRS